MNNLEFKITATLFLVIFLTLFVLSVFGFGAPKYHSGKYDKSNTFFVSGIYSHSPSARVGSVGGPGIQGGGLHAGK